MTDEQIHPLDQFIVPDRKERLEQVLAHRSNNLTIVLDQVQNYHNISAVIRSADALRHLDGTPDR